MSYSASFGLTCFRPPLYTEVKIKPEHMQGASDIRVEPVTPEMAEKVGAPPKVEVTRYDKNQ